jgi:hypothetical protein
MRKRTRSSRGAVSRAGVEAAEKPAARTADRSEENENDDNEMNEMPMARGARMMGPMPPRRTRRGSKVMAKSKKKASR